MPFKKILSNLSISYYFFIWVVLVYSIFYIGFKYQHPNLSYADFFNSLKNWDSGHFLGIAESGYSRSFQYAFFPLYPLMIRLLALVLNSYLISGIIISITASFLGIKLLYKLIQHDSINVKPKKVIFYFLIFPTSFFLLLPYSEALFFLLTVITFYFLSKAKSINYQRNFFLASVSVVLATLTRFVGIVLVLILFWEIFHSKNVKRKYFFILTSLSGLFFYTFYLYLKVGDPVYFLTVETYWQRAINLPVVSFWGSLTYIFSHQYDNFVLTTLIDTFFAVFGLGLAFRSVRFLPSTYSLLAIFSMFLPLSTSSLVSFPRFILPVFPIFILLAMIKNKPLNFFYVFISISLLFYFEINFMNGFWVS